MQIFQYLSQCTNKKKVLEEGSTGCILKGRVQMQEKEQSYFMLDWAAVTIN